MRVNPLTLIAFGAALTGVSARDEEKKRIASVVPIASGLLAMTGETPAPPIVVWNLVLRLWNFSRGRSKC